MDTPLALMSGWQETGSGQRNVNRSEDTTFRKQLREQDCSSLFPLPRAAHPHQDRVPSVSAPLGPGVTLMRGVSQPLGSDVQPE